MDSKLKKGRQFAHILIIPFIWMVIFPLLLLDIVMEIYHRIGFAICQMPYVKRSQYIKIDRQKLSYLNLLGKINCMYCGYANGLMNYMTVIGARTEQYWCGIQHKNDPNFIPPEHHKNFVKYGDEKEFNQRYRKK